MPVILDGQDGQMVLSSWSLLDDLREVDASHALIPILLPKDYLCIE